LDLKEKRVHFIKPSRPIEEQVKLDPVVVANNKLRGVETSIILDTNVLVCMERVVDNGNNWPAVKKYGLHNLVKLLQRCPSESISLSPGLALSEMPPSAAEVCCEKYEIFCSTHLQGFFDSHNSIKMKFSGKSPEYGYYDLSLESKALIAVSFASLIYLHIIDKHNIKDRFAKFTSYLDLLEREMNILSSTEVEIAKYCFSEPKPEARDTIALKRKFRENFLKTKAGRLPETADDVIKIAFNASNDLRLLYTANIIDQFGVDGIPQDCWIATKDEKLVLFCEVFHHVNLDGEVGKYSVSSVNQDDTGNSYWARTDKEFFARNLRRKFQGKPDRSILEHDETQMLEALVAHAERAIVLLREAYA
jgi:hypothetical protein